jgi:hypothetical protein
VAEFQYWFSMGWDPITGDPCWCDHPGGEGHGGDRISALECTAALREECPEYQWLTILWLPDDVKDVRAYVNQAREDTDAYFAGKGSDVTTADVSSHLSARR